MGKKKLIEQHEATIASQRHFIDTLSNALSNVDEQLSDYRVKLDGMQVELDASVRADSDKDKIIADLESTLESQRDTMKRLSNSIDVYDRELETKSDVIEQMGHCREESRLAITKLTDKIKDRNDEIRSQAKELDRRGDEITELKKHIDLIVMPCLPPHSMVLGNPPSMYDMTTVRPVGETISLENERHTHEDQMEMFGDVADVVIPNRLYNENVQTPIDPQDEDVIDMGDKNPVMRSG